MKKKKTLKTTDNRRVYNQTLRNYLYNFGVCDYCKPHSGCNRREHYGGFEDDGLKYPSWKLVSKNPKQWMKKPMKKLERETYWRKKLYVNDCGENVVRNNIYVTFKW